MTGRTISCDPDALLLHRRSTVEAIAFSREALRALDGAIDRFVRTTEFGAAGVELPPDTRRLVEEIDETDHWIASVGQDFQALASGAFVLGLRTSTQPLPGELAMIARNASAVAGNQHRFAEAAKTMLVDEDSKDVLKMELRAAGYSDEEADRIVESAAALTRPGRVEEANARLDRWTYNPWRPDTPTNAQIAELLGELLPAELNATLGGSRPTWLAYVLGREANADADVDAVWDVVVAGGSAASLAALADLSPDAVHSRIAALPPGRRRALADRYATTGTLHDGGELSDRGDRWLHAVQTLTPGDQAQFLVDSVDSADPNYQSLAPPIAKVLADLDVEHRTTFFGGIEQYRLRNLFQGAVIERGTAYGHGITDFSQDLIVLDQLLGLAAEASDPVASAKAFGAGSQVLRQIDDQDTTTGVSSGAMPGHHEMVFDSLFELLVNDMDPSVLDEFWNNDDLKEIRPAMVDFMKLNLDGSAAVDNLIKLVELSYDGAPIGDRLAFDEERVDTAGHAYYPLAERLALLTGTTKVASGEVDEPNTDNLFAIAKVLSVLIGLLVPGSSPAMSIGMTAAQLAAAKNIEQTIQGMKDNHATVKSAFGTLAYPPANPDGTTNNSPAAISYKLNFAYHSAP